jgi:hypothetical protein
MDSIIANPSSDLFQASPSRAHHAPAFSYHDDALAALEEREADIIDQRFVD